MASTSNNLLGQDILGLVDQVQASRFEGDVEFDQEWNFFSTLCEVLSNIVRNKIRTVDGVQQVELLEANFMRMTSNDERVKCVLNDRQVNSVLDFFVDKLIADKQANSCKLNSWRKCSIEAKRLREEGNDLYKKKMFGLAIDKYSQVCYICAIMLTIIKPSDLSG